MGPNCEGTSIKLGQRVGIKFVAGVCMNCDFCVEGSETSCENGTYSGFYIPGTFQQYVLSPANYVTPIPDGVDSAVAAPMLYAGITVYTALRKSGVKSGQWVVISGAGGELGHIACQLASRGMAFRVLVVDAGNKEKLVKDSGPEEFIDILKHDDKSIAAEVKRICGGRGASAVIMCTASNRAYDLAKKIIRDVIEFIIMGLNFPS